MEKCWRIGFITLGTVDFTFCLLTLCESLLPRNNIIHTQKNMAYFFTVYGNYIQNVHIKVSTWCTVIIAASQYIIVTYPIKAKLFMKPVHIVVAIVTSLIMCSVLHIPLLWIWEIKTISCQGNRKSLIVLTFGFFMKYLQIRRIFLIIWFMFGFLIPVVILVFSSIGLIKAFNNSRRFHSVNSNKCTAERRRIINLYTASYRKISITLIGIALLFFICMCPGQILGFYTDLTSTEQSTDTFVLLLVLCNVLQTIKFSGNFVLYSGIICYFRN